MSITGRVSICDDNVIVEILREGQPVAEGETGEVVVTGLHTYSMPFIRYRTGDIATRGSNSCACGQPFSTLLDIQGRAVEYFRFAGDRRGRPYEITGPLIESESEWVFQHQIIQESRDSVRLKITPMPTSFRAWRRRSTGLKAALPSWHCRGWGCER